MGEFGDKFRKAREKKEISLDDVSNVTKIGARMLRAIEEEHFDQLPGGVFNKGFIRAYAKHLGLNDEEAVSDYLACLRQAQIDAHEVWEPQASARAGSAQHPPTPEKRRSTDSGISAAKSQAPVQVEELPDLQLPRAEHLRHGRRGFGGNSNGEIPWRIFAVAAIVVVLAGILWMRHSHNAHTAAASSRSPQTTPTTTAAEIPDSAATSAPESPNQPFNTTPSSSSATSVRPSSQSPNTRQGAPSSLASTNSPGATSETSSAENSGRGEEKNDVTSSTFDRPVPNSSANPAAPLKLVIRAQETSWISVQADGQNVSQETLIAPAHASVRATREIIARIGNAAGVTFLWNGQEIPADGAEAEVKTFVFDANGMRVIPSAQSAVQGR